MDKTLYHINTNLSSQLSKDDYEFGASDVCLMPEDNLLHDNAELNSMGYGVLPFLSPEGFAELKSMMTTFIKGKLSKHVQVPDDFVLENYHKYVPSDEAHYDVAGWSMPPQTIQSSFEEIKRITEKFLKTTLTLKQISHNGIEDTYIGYRIVRPGRQDHSPFHRDAWTPYWTNTINIWVPICGTHEGNSLQLIPKSHMWPEKDIIRTKAGTLINGKKYHITTAVAATQPCEMITPELQLGEGLMFSPYLLHGNGINKHQDITRVSIEIRFCKSL